MRLATALEQDLDLLLRALERGLALPRERDAPLEQLQRLIERQVAPLEAPDQGLELGECLLEIGDFAVACLLYTSPSPRDRQKSRMPSSA